MSDKELRWDMNQTLDNYPHDRNVRQALEELAERRGIRLTPARFTAEGYAYTQEVTDYKGETFYELQLFPNKIGNDKPIDLIPVISHAYGENINWAGKRWKVTWEEVFD